jgi:hypothetical protein
MHQVHFDYSSFFSDAQVEKVGNPKKKKPERAVGWKPNRVSWNWAKSVEGYRAMPEGDNPSFEINFLPIFI